MDQTNVDTIIEETSKDAKAEATKTAAEEAAKGFAGEAGKAAAEEAAKGPAGEGVAVTNLLPLQPSPRVGT